METEAWYSTVDLEEESRRLGLSKHEDPSSDPQHHISHVVTAPVTLDLRKQEQKMTR